MKAIWTPGANADLIRQCDWLRLQSADAADRMFDEILQIADKLAEGRDTGRQSPEFSELRFKSILRWRKVLAYVRTESGIQVFALLDTRMKPPA